MMSAPMDEEDLFVGMTEESPSTYQTLSSLPDMPPPSVAAAAAASVNNKSTVAGGGMMPNLSTTIASASNASLLTGNKPTTGASLPLDSVSGIFVRICDTERHGDEHMSYVIEVNAKKVSAMGIFVCDSKTTHWTLQRRYSDFVLLKTSLEFHHRACLMPPLPEKFESYAPWRMIQQKFDPEFVEYRRQRLESFLHHLLIHPAYGRDDLVFRFLNEGDLWRSHSEQRLLGERVTQYLDRHSASVRMRGQNATLERLKQTAENLQQNVRGVLQSHSQVQSRFLTILKLHKNYGEALCDWCGLDKDMADGLQTMGHLMDTYSGFMDPTGNGPYTTQQEEIELDGKLREYVLYGDTMFQLSRRMELLILAAEVKENRIAQLSKEVEDLENEGTSGFGLKSLKNKIKGVSTPEEKAQKAASLRDFIHKEQEVLEDLQKKVNEFTETVDQELTRFHKQKTKDFEQILRGFCQIQLSLAKRSLRLWTQCRQGLDNLPTSS